MNKQKQWQKPNLGVLKSVSSAKSAVSSRRSETRYAIGPANGPNPAPAIPRSLGPSIGPANGPTPAPANPRSFRDGRVQYHLGPAPTPI